MAENKTIQAASADRMYSARAANYDRSFHVYQGFDFVRWAAVSHGEHVLDLAAGTGLVSIPARKAAGPFGSVTAVDITESMMSVGKAKAEAEGLAIDWRLHDITDLATMDPPLREEGYDVITCASALPLFHNPAEIITGWAKWLRVGGRLVVDFPAEDSQLTGLVFQEAIQAVGVKLLYDRSWLKSRHDLEAVVRAAGLSIQKSFTSSGYWKPESPVDADSDAFWSEWVGKVNVELSDAENKRAKSIFTQGLVRRRAEVVDEDDGRFHIVIGTKRSKWLRPMIY